MKQTSPKRSEQFSFVPTARQVEAIRVLTTERKALDEHVSQGAVIRELVQRGLDALQASRSTGGYAVTVTEKPPSTAESQRLKAQ